MKSGIRKYNKWLASCFAVAFCSSLAMGVVPSLHEKLHEPSVKIHHQHDVENHDETDHDNRSSDHDTRCFLCRLNQGNFFAYAPGEIVKNKPPITPHAQSSENVRYQPILLSSVPERAPPSHTLGSV